MLDKALTDISKRFGRGRLCDWDAKHMEVEAISTGSISLDLVLGVGE